MLPAELQRLGDIEALDTVETGKAARALGGIERRRPLAGVLSGVLRLVDRSILDDALAVQNGQDRARRQAGSFDESDTQSSSMLADTTEVSNADVVHDRLRDVEARFAGRGFGKERAGGEVERVPRTLERDHVAGVRL